MTRSVPVNADDLERIHNRSFEEIIIGESASLERTLTAQDI
jgi:phosphate acetyltransferase/phosphate butyryltransferase